MSHEEKLGQLQEICGIEEQAARHLLEASEWNLEDALHLHFAEGQVASSSREGQPLLNGGLVAGLTGESFLSVARNGYSRTPTDAATASEPQERSFLGAISKAWTTASQALLGVASEDFQQWFYDRYGPPTPRFCKAAFGDAVQEALAERKLLMAWFHQEENSTTQKLCREVLQNEQVLTTLQDDFLLWAGDTARFEPSQVARLLGLQQFPSLVLLQPVANDFHANMPCVEWPLGTFCAPLHSCQFAADGSTLDSDMVVATIQMTAQDYREEVRNVQEEMQRRDLQLAEDRRLREQQDREYEEALLADQLAAIRRVEDSSPAEAEKASEIPEAVSSTDTAKKAAAKEEEEEAQRQRRKDEILAEPEPSASSSTARIRVQLPSGERLQRTFAGDQCLREVYDWAHCCRPVARPKHFELCINFPARSLKDRSATLKELDLVPSAALVLKESEADGDEEK